MRVFLLGNGALAARVAGELVAGGDTIAALALHPEARRRDGEEIVAASRVPADRVFEGAGLEEGETLERIRACGADVGLSVLFGHILRRQLLDALPLGCLNLHPGYLPYNRGAYPNVWSIVEGTPAGATLHHVDEGIDTGDIVAQRRIEVAPEDTGESLYRRLEEACLDLFRETWPLVRSGRAPRVPQRGEGTFHRVRDVERIDAIDPARPYRAGELVDILRARTFPPHRGAYLAVPGGRVYLSLELETE
jgi:methionyl-tRNA formyltransferase